MATLTRPGGAIATRPMHFIWLADCSGSMSQDGKIQALNHAIREAIPHMRRVADDNPHASVLVRAIAFSSGAVWHVSDPTPIDRFRWNDLAISGNSTDLGAAIRLVTAELHKMATGEKLLPPVLALITDGYPTDDPSAALSEMLSVKLGQSATRVAIAIGDDADTAICDDFIANPAIPTLRAHNPDDLVRYIRWASTAVVDGGTKALGGHIQVPQMAPPSAGDQVW